jgi:hypothetical protein
LLETLRDDAAGFRKLDASCEAYTASTPLCAVARAPAELLNFGRDDPEAAIIERLDSEVATRAPDLAPWLPLIAIALDIDVAPTPEVRLLAESNRRAILHRSVHRFLEVMIPETALIEIENAHTWTKPRPSFCVPHRKYRRPAMLIGVAPPPDRHRIHGARRAHGVADRSGGACPEGCAAHGAARIRARHALHMHVIEVVAQRSGGNPHFLRDL